MSRHVTCRDCGQDFETPSVTGRLPLRCAACDPSFASQYRAELVRLRHQVDELEQQLRGERPARLSPSTPAGRNTVAIAVRRVGTAEGKDQTGQRLRELAAEALAWADALGCSETAPPADLTTTEAA